MDEQARVRLSKAMSRALRHDPAEYGLSPDAAGWVAVEALVAGLRRHRRWSAVTAADVATVVGAPGKRRFEISRGRIRAGYGHSLPGRITQVPQPPPELLYHGTAPETLPLIVDAGLCAMRRQYVHLSTSLAVARQVGGRRAPEPVVFVVAAAAAHAAGVGFYAATDPHTWLADAVPSEYLSILDTAAEQELTTGSS